MASASRLDAALARVDEAELVALTRDLVRIPSVVRPDDPDATEARVAAYVARWLRREGLAVEVQPVAPGRPNVVGVLGTGRPVLLLEGHTDVVTEGDPAAWRYPPFGGVLARGRIWGRGAADMKGGLAAAMIAAAALRRSGAPLRGRLVIGALVDEEGAMRGARHFCRTPIGRAVDAAIVCEPEQNELCLEQRGVVWARVRVRGRMAHGAMPEAGRNALAGVAAVLAEAPRLARRLRRLSRRSRHLAPPTVTPTVVRAPLHGPPQPNVVPGGAEVVLDVRLAPGPSAAAVRRELDRLCRRAARRCAGLAVAWEPLDDLRPPVRTPRTARIARAVAAAIRAVTGRAPRFGGVPGSTDGTILHTLRGIPVVTCGPGRRTIPHQVDEYVEVRELVEAAMIYVASAMNFLEA